MTDTGYGLVALKGVLAGGAGQLLRLVIQIGSTLIMVRLLAPDQFGLVAMVVAVIGVADILREMGLSAAAIQAPELSDDMRSNLWWLNTGLGGLASMIVAAASPLIAMAYGEPRLQIIALAMAPLFLLNGMGAQARVSLVRAFRFKEMATVDVISQFIGAAAAILLALAGGGYWSLVAQQLLSPLFTLLAFTWLAGWLPRGFKRGIGTTQFVRFGGAVLGSSVLTYVALNFDSMVVGRALGSAPAGVYNKASQLIRQPLKQVLTPFTAVLLPILSRVQDDDVRTSRMARQIQLFSGLPFLALAAGVIAVHSDLAYLALGPGWEGAGLVMACAAVQSAFRMISSVGAEIMTSRGLGKQLTSLALVTTGVDLAVISLGILWGLTGVALAIAVAPAINWVFSFWWIERHAGVRVGPMIRQGIALILIMIGSAYVGSQIVERIPTGLTLVRVVVGVFAAAACMCSVALVPSMRADLTVILSLLRNRKVAT